MSTDENEREPTRRERSDDPPTRREGGDHSPTSRDGSAPYVRVNLPPEIAHRYEIVRDLASGGEADVLVARRLDRSDGALVVVKVYRPGVEPDLEAIERIRRLPPEHVVRIQDCGFAGGVWWEELEYLEQGSLADLLRREGPRLSPERLLDVIEELASALEAVQPAQVFHCDVKPSNVLVRSSAPLDLVLGDFGLARSSEHSHIFSARGGSLEYESPEALNDHASPARDWWAAGMIFAEAAIGHHPLLDPSASLPTPQEIRVALTTRAIPLDGIADGRIRLLCRGLLIRDLRDRWGAEQVRSWQRGESPPIEDESAVQVSGRIGSVPPFIFEGQHCETPEALAPLLAAHWQPALKLLSGSASEAPDYVRLHTWLEEHGDEASLRILDLGGRETSFARRLYRLIRVLQPDLPPSFRGYTIDRRGLVDLGQRAAAGDEDAAAAVEELQRLGIIGEIAREAGGRDLVGLDERWQEQIDLLGQLRNELGPIGAPLADPVTSRAAHARILVALLDDRALQELADQVSSAATEPAFTENEQMRQALHRVLGQAG